MLAWMQAWSQSTDGGVSNGPASATTTVAVPINLRMQVATLLADIILGLPQEAIS